jgi:MFS family permease
MFILSGVISAFGFGVCHPSLQTLCMRLVPKERRGVASNTSYLGTDLGFLVGPTLGGAIITLVQSTGGSVLLGYSVMFAVMIVPILVALGVFLFRKKALLGKIASADISAKQIAESSIGETDAPM